MAIEFTINFDTRTKEVLLDCLMKEMSLAEDAISSGDYSQEALMKYEELLRIRRGILYVRTKELESNAED